MFDILVNPSTGDIAYNNGEVTLIRSYKKIVRQELEITLKTFRGEWFNNITFGGINKDHFGDPRVTKLEVDAFYRTIILSNPDVIEIIEFESELNPFTRHYDLNFTVRTLEGPVTVELTSADQEETYVQPDSDIYLPPTTPSVKSAAAFLSGTSSLVSIASSVPIPIVSPPIEGTSSLSGTAIKLLQPVTLGQVATLTATMTKVGTATLAGTATLSGTLIKASSAFINGVSSSLSATLSKTDNPTLTGIGGVSGTLVKVGSATLAGTSTLSGDTGLTSDVTLQGQSTVSGTLVKVASATLTGTSTTNAVIARAVSATVDGTSTLTGLLAKTTTANLSGTSNITASAVKAASAVVTGVSGLNGVMVKSASANVSGGVSTFQANWTYGSSGSVDGQSYLSATATKVKYSGANLTGSSGAGGYAARIKTSSVVLTGNSGLTGNILFGAELDNYDLTLESLSTPLELYLPMQETGTAVSGATVKSRLIKPPLAAATALFTANGTPILGTSSISRSKYSFDGTSSGFDISGSSPDSMLDIYSTTSYAMWIRPDVLANHTLLVLHNGSISSPTATFNLTSSGALSVTLVDGANTATWLSPNLITANKTYFVVFRINLNAANFVDMVDISRNNGADATLTYTPSANFESNFDSFNYLSSQYTLGTTYTGKMERFSVHITNLSLAQRTALYSAGIDPTLDEEILANEPEGYWKLLAGTGVFTAEDSSVNSRDLTYDFLYDTAETIDITGYVGDRGRTFEGDYQNNTIGIANGDFSIPNMNGEISLVSWLRIPVTPTNGVLFRRENSFSVYYDSSGATNYYRFVFFDETNSSNYAMYRILASSIPTNSTPMLAFSFNANSKSLKVWVNGVQVGVTLESDTLASGNFDSGLNGEFVIGGSGTLASPGGEFFAGYERVALFSKDISSQIDKFYRSGKRI